MPRTTATERPGVSQLRGAALPAARLRLVPDPQQSAPPVASPSTPWRPGHDETPANPQRGRRGAGLRRHRILPAVGALAGARLPAAELAKQVLDVDPEALQKVCVVFVIH